MGSAGFGTFGNYHIGDPKDSNQGNGSSSGGNGIGGAQREKTDYINLEDVPILDYFLNNNNVPSALEPVFLSDQIHNGRLVVISSVTLEIIGNVPTKYNYLLNDIKMGINYIGEVRSSGLSPIPFVVVSLHE